MNEESCVQAKENISHSQEFLFMVRKNEKS
jgi:hypothetical protein